jgi:hypothetical protein
VKSTSFEFPHCAFFSSLCYLLFLRPKYSQRFFEQDSAYISHFLHACCMFLPSHPFLFKSCIWRVQIMQVILMSFSLPGMLVLWRVGWYTPLIRRVLVRVIGFISSCVTLTHRQYSAIADTHTFQFTIAHALGFSLSTSRLLAMDFDTQTTTVSHSKCYT